MMIALRSGWHLATVSLAVVFLLSHGGVTAQFSCTLSGMDETTCLNIIEDTSQQHCAWCTLSAFSVCLSEVQAEAMEARVPTVTCNRYSDNDDKAPPDQDDAVVPTDDVVPDDFWTCLTYKDAKACRAGGDDCTWCLTKVGFGLCMSGPAAESASNSTWFQCPNRNSTDVTVVTTNAVWIEQDPEEGNSSQDDVYMDLDSMELMDDDARSNQYENNADVEDPYDTTCLLAYLQDPREDVCQQALDQEGQPCEFCSLPGVLDFCLTQEQADLGMMHGLNCAESSSMDTMQQDLLLRGSNPYDPTCVMAFMQGGSKDKDSCVAVLDEDDQPCKWCSFQDLADLCLTQQQAEMTEQFGMNCDDDYTGWVEPEWSESTDDVVDWRAGQDDFFQPQQQRSVDTSEDFNFIQNYFEDPYDTACLLAYLEDQSEQACEAAKDSDGQPCEYCSLQGSFNLCLNEEQASMAESMGVTCNSGPARQALLQDMKQDEPEDLAVMEDDLYDKNCVVAFIESGGDRDVCRSAIDQDGLPCLWCHLNTISDLCLTETQADMAGQVGVWCDGGDEMFYLNAEAADRVEPEEIESQSFAKEQRVATEDVQFPPDFLTCLENYEEHACNQNACTWCSTEVGMGFCMADTVADAMRDCDFFDCDYKQSVVARVNMAENQEDADEKDFPRNSKAGMITPYDPLCLTAGMQNQDDAQDACQTAQDSDGQPCVWCNAAGVFGLCLSHDQADMARNYLDCNAMVESATF